MHITRLEAPNGDTQHGGVLCVFEDKRAYTLQWHRGAPIVDTLAAAKELATQLVHQLIQEDQRQRLHSLNVPSVVASFQYHLKEWNDKRRAALYAEVQPVPRASHDASTHRDAGAQITASAPLLGMAEGLGAVHADCGGQGTGGEPPIH